jgi:hypothetical protein
MSVRLHPEKLRFNLDTIGFSIDMAMIVLVIANLSLIIFDWFFAMTWLQQQLSDWTPTFFNFYQSTIHSDFVFWDSLFVAIYLTEFVIRWGFAIGRHRYERWYYYPFAHWYDLLGCIPVGSFRWLRILRLVSLLYRLQRHGLIDLRETWLGALLLRYYRILVEEVSDRVVVNVLEGAQRELRTDAPLVQRIEREVLSPRKHDLIDFAATTLIDAADHSHRRWRLALGSYIASLTREALAHTSIGGTLNAIPGAGPRLLASLSAQAEEIGLAFADQIIADLKNPVHRSTVDEVLESIIIRAGGDRQALDHLIRDTLLALLDQVKEQVAVKQWQLTANEPRPDN